jgi:thymidine kinase
MIKVFTGPMFSGKTNGLISTYDNMWNKDIIQCFKPKLDNRDYGIIKSRHTKTQIKASLIVDISEIKKKIKSDITTIFIDEFQFLKGDIKTIVDMSLYKDKDFYISGLNITSELEPFGIMPQIMSVADEIIFYEATCFYCNKPARYTMYKGIKNKDTILVGSDEYVPVCKKCYIKYNKKQKIIKKDKEL